MNLVFAAAAVVLASVGSITPFRPAPITPALPPETGRAVVECVVGATGSLSDCKVVEETPVGHGVGRRALEASANMKMGAPVVDGQTVAGLHVRIPFTFEL
jgi:TonB family protein